MVISHAAVHPCTMPADAALGAYASRGAYTDCYGVELTRVVTLAEYVEAFYTTAVFKLERWLIARLLSRPSSDAQIRRLAQGELNSFAAWSVEQRGHNQIVLAAGRTRSWLMVCPSDTGTKLYFGSAVVPRKSRSGRSAMGWGFSALLSFHRLYSWVLLSAARRRLCAKPGEGSERFSKG